MKRWIEVHFADDSLAKAYRLRKGDTVSSFQGAVRVSNKDGDDVFAAYGIRHFFKYTE